MNVRKLLLFVLVLLAIGVFFAFDLDRYLSVDELRMRHQEVISLRAEYPIASAALYFVTYVLVTALSLPGAAVMTLAGGAVFGLVTGTVLVSFASTLGATLAMLVARFLLRDVVQARFGDRIAAIDAGIERDGALYLFTLRLVPLFPFFVINLVMGLTAMRARTFAWVSQLGMLPGTIVFVNAGTQLAQVRSPADVLSPGLLASFALLGIFPLLARRVVALLQARKVYRGWKKPRRFDRNLVVIGAGSAGLVTAYIAATVRAGVTLVERHRMGGDCLNTGCVPSKALLRSAKLLDNLRRAREFGLGEASARFDFAEVMERVQRVIRTIEPHDSVERYRGLGVDVVQGDARITSPWSVEVNGQTLTTRSIVIASGAGPFVPPVPGIEEVGYLTSDTLWDLRELPKRLLVLGGGPIGCELAQAFQRLGAQVTQVEMLPRLLIREDAEIGALVAERFRAEGMDVRLGHKAKAFRIDNGRKLLTAEHEDGEVDIEFDALLVAVGRRANTEGLGLEELGIARTRAGTIETDDFLATRFPNIYACGDVAGPYQFTHTAAHQAWYAAVNALFSGFKRFRVDYRVIPWATFTEPEVARVGLNEQDARERGVAFEVTRYGLDDLDRAIADGEAHGFVKVLTEPGRDRILGVTIVGEHAGDLIAEYVLAMKQGIGLNTILGTIHIYPTLAEANKFVAGEWKRAHAPRRALAWLGRFHAWRRGAG